MTTLHIITPVTRPQNLFQLIENVQESFSKIDWHIHFVADDCDIDCNNTRNIHYYRYSGPESIGGLQRNVVLDSYHFNEDDYLYFLDDDNLIHPDFERHFLNSLDHQLMVFGQLESDGQVRLPATKIAVGQIDAAMYVVRYQVAKKTRFTARYEADYDFVNQIYELCETYYFSNEFCTYYNAIQ